MSRSFRLRGTTSKNYRKALLPVAVSLAMLSLSAQAADSWVATRTGAALSKGAAPAGAAAASTQIAQANTAAGYVLSLTGHPSVPDNLVSPLESSKAVHVAVSLKLRNAEQLNAFLAELDQKGSPNYHKYLTPAQFKAKYSPTDAQVQQVVAHLERSGFSNIVVADNNQLVSADGNATNVSSAFRTNLKRFSFAGKDHFANDSAVSVPSALGSIVGSVVGLQDYAVKHTMYHKAELVNPQAAKPQAGSAVAHSPADFGKIYGGSSLPAATNTTVGVITWGSMTQVIKDLGTFTSNAGLATVSTQTVNVGSGTFWNDASSNVEWCLDSQSIVGTSGGVQKLIFYAAVNGTNDASLTDAGISAAYNKAVTDNVAKVVNISLGEDETAAQSSGTLASDDQIFAQAAAQGQTFSASSGDEGVYESYGGDLYKHGTTTLLSGVSLSNYSVSEPAVSPNVIAVGGTTLSTTNTTTWAGETVWNEGLSQDQSKTADDRLWATGGGVSKYETAPAWQTSALGSSVTKRVLPDVAFDAAQSTGALIYANGSQYQVGGTSLASPIFVGAYARLQSANGNALGFPASKFYAAFSNSANAALLHDVTSGNNGYNGYGYNAAAGFDYTTGFGSFDIGKVNTYAQANWGGGGSTNVPPVANFSDTTSGLTATFTDSSTDSDGSIASRSWNFGDGSTSTTTSPSHTYAAAGTYSVSLTVTDNAGATNTKTQSVTVSSGSTGGLQNGVAVTGLSAAKGKQLNYTVNIPAGSKNLKIAITGSTSSSNDADLYVKFGSAPTTSSYDCRPYVTGSNESCSVTSPQTGTYYIMLNGYSAFSGVTLKATWTN